MIDSITGLVRLAQLNIFISFKITMITAERGSGFATNFRKWSLREWSTRISPV